MIAYEVSDMAKKVKKEAVCFNCKYFRNEPAYLESVYKGFSTLGSAHGSVRKDDGICEKRELYLSAWDWCDDFTISNP